jgi:peptide chain release factor 1
LLNKKNVKIETMRGQGAGGQHKNKTDSCVRATHIPTGISVTIDGRKQAQNKKKAITELKKRVAEAKADKKALARKAHRDDKIKNMRTIRTYDFKRGIVKNHRTGKTASLRDVLEKGKIELINEGFDED